MAALVAAALAQVGDATPRLAAILADRYRRGWPVLLAAAAALLGAGLLAAFAGALLAPRLTPEAKLLMLALACLLQGGGALFPTKAPDRLEHWRLGAFFTSFVGLFILAFGDGIQFVVLTLAARSPVPWLAAVGATLGSLAVIAPAVLLGEAGWTALPLARARTLIALLFLVTGVMLAASALSLA